MKHYVRDWKNIVVVFKEQTYKVKALINIGPKGGYYGIIIDKITKRVFKVRWSAFHLSLNHLPVVDRVYNKAMYRVTQEAALNICRLCILIYQTMLNDEKGISTCPARQMTDEERQVAVESSYLKEKKIYENYSSSAEYKSGVPYYFYRAKTKTVCAKDSDYVDPYVRRTYFADETIVSIYKVYRNICMNCNKRATCHLECLSEDEKSYVMRYIASMVDSDEVIEFETGISTQKAI